MKKNKKIIIFLSLAIVLIISTCVFAVNNSFFDKWGEYLSGNDHDKEGKYSLVTSEFASALSERVDEEDILYIGKDIIVSKYDVEQAEQFYILSGYDANQAKEMGIDYVKKYNAMFVEAIRNGYSATDEEVDAKIESLKESFEKAENKEQMMQVISKFPSEDEYWEYEHRVYKKSLPIEKYREALECKVRADSSSEYGSEEFQIEWLAWYDKYQEEVASKQGYLLWERLSDTERQSKIKKYE